MENKLSKAELIQAPRGTKDILPDEAKKWREIERAVDDVATLFGYGEIRTPIFEQLRLFRRAVGEETDIVSKEMFLLQSKSEDEEFALRPELTAPVVRAAIEHGLLTGQSDCLRLYYNSAPNFRYEKPQKGRFRQFHQFGTELLGPDSPLADAETISFAISVYRRLGLSNFKVRLNSLASPSSRETWKQILVDYLRLNLDLLSDESKRRTETNPMRVLDSKDPRDQAVITGAPLLSDFLSQDDRDHFESLQLLLRQTGIEFTVDPLLVRGLDYYTRTVFEITSSDLGSQDALCGGGRYDMLVQQLGGPETPAFGFGAGMERLLIALESPRQAAEITRADHSIYVIALSSADAARPYRISPVQLQAFETTSALRHAGLTALMDLNGRSMKAQMREANREKTHFTYIIGENEIKEGSGILKNMQSGEQAKISFDTIAEAITNRLPLS